MRPPETLEEALDELSTLAPHRVRGVPSGEGVAYQFYAPVSGQVVWGHSLSGALAAIIADNGLHHISSTAAPYSVAVYRRGVNPDGMVRAVGNNHLAALAIALAAYLRQELVKCAP